MIDLVDTWACFRADSSGFGPGSRGSRIGGLFDFMELYGPD